MTQEETILVKNAIEVGIFNDLGNGSNVDIFIITRKGCEKKNHIDVIIKRNIINLKIMYFQKELLKLLKKIKRNGKILKLVRNQF